MVTNYHENQQREQGTKCGLRLIKIYHRILYNDQHNSKTLYANIKNKGHRMCYFRKKNFVFKHIMFSPKGA